MIALVRGSILLGLVLVACRPRQPAGQDQPGPEGAGAMEQMSGRVFVTGSRPDVSITLVLPQGSSTRLVGDLEGELGRLSGATVRVRGKPGSAPRPKTLTVQSYDVLEVDGEVPKVGTLLVEKGGLRLAGRDTVELSNPPEELSAKAGAKVWIVGRAEGGKLAVQSYGILREGGR